MNKVIQHIQYLISRYDCVIVPGLGAFVAQRIPASFSTDAAAVTPPRRLLAFNALLTHDDGLLIGSVARRESISYDAARTLVTNDVDLIRHTLEARRSLLIPRIGTLSFSAQHHTISFMPYFGHDAMAAYALSALPELTLSPMATTATEPTVLHVTPRRSSALRRAFRYAASVMLLLGIGFIGSTPIIVEPDDMAHASLAFPTPQLKPTILPIETDIDSAAADFKFVYSTADSTAVEDAIVPADKVGSQAFAHYVIVASSPTLAGARMFIRNHPGEAMDIIAADGRYRVFTSASNDFFQASQSRYADEDFAQRHPDAWIFSPES